jgi:hypothetical protein
MARRSATTVQKRGGATPDRHVRTTDTLTIMSENTMCILVDVMRDDTDLVRVANRVRGAAEEPITMGENRSC